MNTPAGLLWYLFYMAIKKNWVYREEKRFGVFKTFVDFPFIFVKIKDGQKPEELEGA